MGVKGRKTIIENKIKALDIEVACSILFNYRTNIIVPNISWGIGIHECDLFIIRSNTGYCVEVEIKVSLSDLKKDLTKKHNHDDDRIKELYFAIPEYLYESSKDFIPKHAGIIVCYFSCEKIKAKIIKSPTINKHARKLSIDEQFKVAKLGCLRIWNLKYKLEKYSQL